jgi:hypothetical protein
MRDDICLVVDTTSKYSDVWKPYFEMLKKYFPENIKVYVFTDNADGLNYPNATPIYYNNNDSYRNQFLSCLKQVEEKYMLYNSEDYILYNKVQMDKIDEVINVLELEKNYDFVKFIKGPEETEKFKDYKNLHIINSNSTNFFAQQSSIWKTSSFTKVFEESIPENGRMQQEPMGSEVCRRIGINGLQYFEGTEVKRGIFHWDSNIYPCIATAINKGKWNLTEYYELLNPILNEFNINPTIRGII